MEYSHLCEHWDGIGHASGRRVHLRDNGLACGLLHVRDASDGVPDVRCALGPLRLLGAIRGRSYRRVHSHTRVPLRDPRLVASDRATDGREAETLEGGSCSRV